jgi:quercetin dioxygenase-like cupin family protein
VRPFLIPTGEAMAGPAVVFPFSVGHELSPYTAPMAAVLHFLKGEAELRLGSEKRNVRTGALVHMARGYLMGLSRRPHSSCFLLILKQV